MEYKDKLKELKSLIEEQEENNKIIYASRVEFEESQVDNYTINQKISEEIDILREDLKIDAIELYEKDGNKKLYGGLGIRITKVLDYSQDTAFKWALEHKLCIMLNKREFEKIAKTQDIDFVTKGENIIVTFPKEIKLEDGE